MYAPSDFKDDKSFLRTLTPEELEKKLDKEVEESLSKPEESPREESPAIQTMQHDRESFSQFRRELQSIEKTVIEKISKELGVEGESNIGIGDTGANFDAFFPAQNEFTCLEVKALRHSAPSFSALDRLLYNAVIADRFFEGKFKLIIVVVYYFEEEELCRVKEFWTRRIEKCPVKIELRFLPKSDVLDT